MMDKEENAVVPAMEEDSIRSRILTIRGVQVMLDRDLSELYGVQTKVLNQAVKRNSIRLPANFMFPLNDAEMQGLFIKGTNVLNRSRSQIVTLNNGREHNIKYRPNVGASLNHLGKRCFAFSAMDKSNIPDILAEI